MALASKSHLVITDIQFWWSAIARPDCTQISLVDLVDRPIFLSGEVLNKALIRAMINIASIRRPDRLAKRRIVMGGGRVRSYLHHILRFGRAVAKHVA